MRRLTSPMRLGMCWAACVDNAASAMTALSPAWLKALVQVKPVGGLKVNSPVRTAGHFRQFPPQRRNPGA
jgi:hypothetical protein